MIVARVISSRWVGVRGYVEQATEIVVFLSLVVQQTSRYMNATRTLTNHRGCGGLESGMGTLLYLANVFDSLPPSLQSLSN